MLTAIVFVINFCKFGEVPTIMTMVGTSCIDIGSVFLYLFFVNFTISAYFSNKREYVLNILSIKKDKKNDKGTP